MTILNDLEEKLADMEQQIEAAIHGEEVATPVATEATPAPAEVAAPVATPVAEEHVPAVIRWAREEAIARQNNNLR